MIYLDNAATTKPSEDALKFAKVFNNEKFFNPSALYHGGLENKKEIKLTKDSVINNLCASDFDVIFTSCGTESDNMATFCVVKKGCYVTDKGEHSAINQSFLFLKNKGENVHFVGLNKDGSVNTDELYDYVSNNKVDFVSIMHVNNETGAINDVTTIAKKLKQINKNIIFHSDGVQAYGKIPFVLTKDIDLYSISAHKINGLRGVACLLKRKKLNIAPYIIGGGQENGLRSGTENVFGIKVFEYVGKEHYKNLKENLKKVQRLKQRVMDGLDKDVFTLISGENSSPYILCVSAKGLRGEVVMHSLEEQGIYVGNGSACSSKNRYSRVIEACGYKNDVLDGVIRVSFSSDNTIEEIDEFVMKVNSICKRLKGIMKK